LPFLCFWPAAVESILHNQVSWIKDEWITEKQIEAEEDDYRVLQSFWGEAGNL